MLTQSTVTLSNPLPGEQGMESPRGGQCSVVQDVHQGGLSSGCQRVRLPLLEEHAARLQELGQNSLLQLEGGPSLFRCGESESLCFDSPKFSVSARVCLVKVVQTSMKNMQ